MATQQVQASLDDDLRVVTAIWWSGLVPCVCEELSSAPDRELKGEDAAAGE